MIFGKQRKNVQFSANNIELEIVKNYHFLGITFTKNKRMIQTIKENTAKGKRAMYAIITRAKTEGISIKAVKYTYLKPLFCQFCYMDVKYGVMKIWEY